MSRHWSRRRTLTALAALPAATLAGCSSPLSTTTGERQTYTLLVDSLGESLAEHLLWSPRQFDSPTDDLQAEARRQAVEDGRFTTYGFAAIDEDGEYTEYEGSYYRLSVVVTGEKPVDRHILRLRWLGEVGDEGVPEPDAAVKDLPSVDRNAARIAYVAARGRLREGNGAPEEIIERGGYVYRRGLADESVLVPDPEYETLSHHGTALRVEVSEERIREPAYTVVATKLGDSTAEYAAAVDAAELDLRLSSDDFSEEERRIVLRAKGDSYEETTPLSEEYDSVLAALELDDVDEGGVRRYLRYDGEDYEYELYVNPA